jgi:hypothetical protein
MAKAYATEAAQRIIDEGVQILGGRGVLAESVVDRLYRSIRALRIYEGTTEIQHLIVAGRILADARERSGGRGDEREDAGRDEGGRDEAGGPADGSRE